MGLLLALDQGTTSSRAIVFDDAGAVRSVAQREFEQIFPRPGWVEHDPLEIWSSQHAVALEALAMLEAPAATGAPQRAQRPQGVSVNDLAAIGITNQRETTIVWDRTTGEPVHNAIVWQDRRTAEACAQLVAAGAETLVRERTGLVIDAYFSASKIAWILEHVPGARARAERGTLCAGTVDSWLVYRLTGGAVHATDVSNASRTMLFDIHRGAWDDELLALFGVPRAMLPEVRPSSAVWAETARDVGLGGAPIAGVAGDQQAALAGQLCFAPGDAKCTYGTGCFLLRQTGATPVRSRHRLLTTVAWRRGNDGALQYALEGSVFAGGATVQWLRDGLGIIERSEDIETLARSVDDTAGVHLVPAFTGLGAPHWDADARGLICGLTRGTTRAHVARAALEGIAHQVADLLDAMSADVGTPSAALQVDGGAANNDLLMQMQADLAQVTIVRPALTETTAFGAALLAGLAVGVWKEPDEVADRRAADRDATDRPTADRRFEPTLSRDAVAEARARWNQAVARARV